MARVFTDGGAMKLISAAQRLTNENNFSVAFWFFRTATPAAQRDIITASELTVGPGWIVRLTTGNLINAAFPFSTTDKQRTSTTAPALNTWVHVVVTHNFTGFANTDFTFYFNGKAEAGSAVATGAGTHDTATAANIEIGASTADGLLAAPANIGPVAIWNRAISPAEALALAGGMHPLRFKEGLIDLFDLDTAHGEEGWLGKLYLVQGATNPSSAAVSPAVEKMPSLIEETRLNVRPRVRSRARYSAVSFVNTPVAIAVASTFTAVLSKTLNYSKSLAVTSAFSPALSRAVAYLRSLSVSTAWTTTLSRLALRSKLLAVSGTFTAALAKFNTHPITIAASGTWTTAIARAKGMLLAVTSTFSPTISRAVAYVRTLAVGSGFVAALQRNITKTLAVASTFTPSVVKGRLTLKTLAVTSAMTALVTRSFGYARALAASSTFAPAITKRLFLSQLLVATSSFVPSIAKRLGLRIGFAISSVFSTILTKIKTAFGIETSSLSGNVRNYARLDGNARSYVRLDGTARTAARLTGDGRSYVRLTGDVRTRARLDGEVRNYPVAV